MRYAQITCNIDDDGLYFQPLRHNKPIHEVHRLREDSFLVDRVSRHRGADDDSEDCKQAKNLIFHGIGIPRGLGKQSFHGDAKQHKEECDGLIPVIDAIPVPDSFGWFRPGLAV